VQRVTSHYVLFKKDVCESERRNKWCSTVLDSTICYVPVIARPGYNEELCEVPMISLYLKCTVYLYTTIQNVCIFTMFSWSSASSGMLFEIKKIYISYLLALRKNKEILLTISVFMVYYMTSLWYNSTCLASVVKYSITLMIWFKHFSW
jgi:hypothetical protein